jgi:hypothetical protein
VARPRNELHPQNISRKFVLRVSVQASDSSNFGHAMACCAILPDAMTEDKLIDNRPKSSGNYHVVAKELNEWAKARAEKAKK